MLKVKLLFLLVTISVVKMSLRVQVMLTYIFGWSIVCADDSSLENTANEVVYSNLEKMQRIIEGRLLSSAHKKKHVLELMSYNSSYNQIANVWFLEIDGSV